MCYLKLQCSLVMSQSSSDSQLCNSIPLALVIRPLTQTLNYKQNFEKKSVHEMNSKTLILGKLAFVPMGQKL